MSRAIGVAIAGTLGIAACGPTTDDVRRWEGTVHGPEKLAALVDNDKAKWPLRDEAALSLVRMKPRMGRNLGSRLLVTGRETDKGMVPGALHAAGEEACRHLVKDIGPRLVEGLREPRPPVAAKVDPPAADPSVSFKDVTFALLASQPPVAMDDKTRADLAGALAQWAQADFLERDDDDVQEVPVRDVIRYLGAPAATSLPLAIAAGSKKVHAASSLVADVGDADTKKRASEALVALAKVDSASGVDELERVLADMNAVGGAAAVDYCLSYSRDSSKPDELRALAQAVARNAGKDRVSRGHAFDSARGSYGEPLEPPFRLGAPVLSMLPSEPVVESREKLRACYRQGLAKDPELRGLVSVKATFDASGAITATSIDPETDLPDDAVVRCMADALVHTHVSQVTAQLGTGRATVVPVRLDPPLLDLSGPLR